MSERKGENVFRIEKKYQKKKTEKLSYYFQLKTNVPIPLFDLQTKIQEYFASEQEKQTAFLSLLQEGYKMTKSLLTDGGLITTLGTVVPMQSLEIKDGQIQKELNEKKVLSNASYWGKKWKNVMGKIAIPDDVSIGDDVEVLLVAPNAVQDMTYAWKERRFGGSVYHIFTGSEDSPYTREELNLSNAINNLFKKQLNDAKILHSVSPGTLSLVSTAEIIGTQGRGVVSQLPARRKP